jgi:MoxR-like ATPase
MKIPFGTTVRVSRDNGYYEAFDCGTGAIIEGIAPAVLARAFNAKCAIVFTKTSTGGTYWKSIPLPPSSSTSTPKGTVAPAVKDAPKTALPIPTSETEYSAFIASSYAMKPALLKITETPWKSAVRAVLRGENMLFTGPAGCGKTMMARILADVFNRPFYNFNMGATQDPRSTLIGNTHFKKDEGTFVAPSLFLQAIQIPNAVILLDELSRAHPEAHNILMTALDMTQRYVRVDEAPDSPTIKVAKGVCFLATANVGSEYTATRTMDRALWDRFSVVEMAPLGKEDELDLLTKAYPAVDKKTLLAITEIAEQTRLQVKQGSDKIDTIISTRQTMRMGGMLKDGFTLAEVADSCIFPFYSDAGGTDSPRAFMKQTVQRWLADPATKDKKSPYTTNNLNPDGVEKPWG